MENDKHDFARTLKGDLKCGNCGKWIEPTDTPTYNNFGPTVEVDCSKECQKASWEKAFTNFTGLELDFSILDDGSLHFEKFTPAPKPLPSTPSKWYQKT